MIDLKKAAREILAAQPFSQLIGTQIEEFNEKEVVLKLVISDQLKQHHGFVHGGVLSYLADNAITFAGGSVLGALAVTSEFKINYLRPAVGEYLLARAHVVYKSKNQAVCRCDVILVGDGRERVCAIGQGTIVRLGEKASAAR